MAEVRQTAEGERRFGWPGRRGRRWAAVAAALAVAAAGFHCWGPRKVRCVEGRLRVAACQYDSRLGEYRWNAEHALRYAREAARNGAGVVILPEYSFCTVAEAVSGAAFKEMRHLMRRLGPRLRRFCRRHRCYLFVNLPHEPHVRAPEKAVRHNRTLVYAPDGRVVATYDKHVVASLDEWAGVRKGKPIPPVELSFGKVGLLICRDATEPESFPGHAGADLIVAQFGHLADWMNGTNAPPWMFNELETVQEDFPRLAKGLGKAFGRNAVFANKTGLEPDGVFTGGTCVVGTDGEILARAGFGGDILYADFELDGAGRLVPEAPPVPYVPGKDP